MSKYVNGNINQHYQAYSNIKRHTMYEKAYHINRRTDIIRRIIVQSCSVNRNKPQIRQQKNRTRSIWREYHKTIRMALRKYDTANSEQFVTPVRGLYSENAISIEDFKDRNVELMKNHWIDTVMATKVRKSMNCLIRMLMEKS